MSAFRKPKGNYARTTPDWFNARQCFASAFGDVTSDSPSLIGATSNAGFTCPVPAGVTTGDLLLALVPSASTPPTVGTWAQAQSAAGFHIGPVFYHYVAPGDPASYSADGSSAIGGFIIVAVRNAGMSGVPPFDALAIANSGASPQAVAAATPTSGKSELYFLWQQTAIFNTWGAAPGLTQLANLSDPAHGNTNGLQLSSFVTDTTIAGENVAYTGGGGAVAGYQQMFLERTIFGTYASLFNNATDGSVLYVTGLEVDFDAADQLLVMIRQGADQNPYSAPFGCFSTNPQYGGPVGTLFSVQSIASNLVAYILQTPKNVITYSRRPSDGSYIAILPPGYSLAVTNGNMGAKQISASFDYLVLPN